MNPTQPVVPVAGDDITSPSFAKKNPGTPKIRMLRHDIVLNVDLKEAMIRFGVTLLLPILALLIDKHWVIYTVPVATYLFISGIIRFCVFKYLWHRYIKQEPAPEPKKYGEDPNYPEESI